jgi:hypothetical protein
MRNTGRLNAAQGVIITALVSELRYRPRSPGS